MEMLVYVVFSDDSSFKNKQETFKAAGPFYLVAKPAEVKYPTQGVNVCITCRELHRF